MEDKTRFYTYDIVLNQSVCLFLSSHWLLPIRLRDDALLWEYYARQMMWTLEANVRWHYNES